MNSTNRSTRARTILALGITCVSIGGASAAAAPYTGTTTPGPIKSGAGPGWPATLSPRDFVPRVTNPWFPLKPGSVWRYKGLKEGVKTTDTVTVTHRTKRILGVA